MPSCKTKSLWCFKFTQYHYGIALSTSTWHGCQPNKNLWQLGVNSTINMWQMTRCTIACMIFPSPSHHDLLATICLTWETSHIRRTIRPIITSKVIKWCSLLQIDIICWRNPPHLWFVYPLPWIVAHPKAYFCCAILRFSMAIGITCLNKFARCLHIRAHSSGFRAHYVS